MYTYAILEGAGSDPDPPPSPPVNLLKIGFGLPSLRHIRRNTLSLQNNPTNLWIGVHVLHTFIEFVPVIFFNLSTKIKTTCISNLIKYFNTLTNYIFTFKHDNRGNPIVTITNVLFYDLLRKRRLEVEFNGDIFMADMMPSIQLS